MAAEQKIPVVKTVAEFVIWIEGLGKEYRGPFLYRGQSNESWEVKTSALRRIETAPSEESKPFLDYIKIPLERAREQGHGYQEGRELPDLELLAKLQHHGGATCLIDFTKNPLVALWFACRGNSEKNGKVVVFSSKETTVIRVGYNELKKEIPYFLGKNKLWEWTPRDLDKRIPAQHSVFIFGEPKIKRNQYKAVEISAEYKNSILQSLENFYGTTEVSLFRDFPGFALSNAHNKPYGDYSPPSSTEAEQRKEKEQEAIELENFCGIPEAYLFRDFVGFAQANTHDKPYGDRIPPPVTEVEQRKEKEQEAIEQEIEAYSRVIALDPKSVVAYNNRGNAKYILGDYKGAIEDFNKAISLDSQFAEAYNSRGAAKYTSKKYKSAIEDFNKAISLNPQYAEAYHNRGSAKSRLGKREDAIEDFNEAVELKPHFAEAYGNRGAARYALRDYRGAIEDYTEAIKLGPQLAGAYNNRGRAKEALGDHEGIIEDYDKAIALNPEFTEAYCNRGYAKSASGDYQGAIEDCDIAISLNPQFAPAYHNREKAKRALGDHKGAEEDRKNIRKLKIAASRIHRRRT